MNPANDQRFRELAMKLVGRECTAEEKAELRRMVEAESGRREELQRICQSAGVARELLPLVSALEATAGRMSAGEMEYFRLAVARRREQRQNQANVPPADSPPPEDPEPPVIDAEIVPEKPINGYKVSFYVLLLLILAAGCALLFKSCMNDRNGRDAAKTPTNAAPVIADQNGQAEARSEPDTPTPAVPAPQVEKPPVTRPPERQNATRTKLGNYAGTQWVKLADSYAVPGSVLFFRSFVRIDSSPPLIEGMIGPNTHVPNQFMLIRRQGNTWNARSYPNIDQDPKWVLPLDSTRVLIASQGMQREVSVIENGRSRDIRLPSQASIIAAHAGNGGAIFLHDHNGGVFEVSGTSMRQLPDTDPGNYVQDQGSPTGMRRGFVRAIARADSGDIMGVCYPEPPGGRPANLVRFDGSNWHNVVSLGAAYPGRAIHFLSGDSMVAALSREFLIVQRGETQSLGSPAEFEADRSLEWMAVRAASTEDFVAVDSSGRIYHYRDGNFEQTVAPLAQYPKAGAVNFRSVMIAPDGVIYAIYSRNQWSGSVLFQLTPK